MIIITFFDFFCICNLRYSCLLVICISPNYVNQTFGQTEGFRRISNLLRGETLVSLGMVDYKKTYRKKNISIYRPTFLFFGLLLGVNRVYFYSPSVGARGGETFNPRRRHWENDKDNSLASPGSFFVPSKKLSLMFVIQTTTTLPNVDLMGHQNSPLLNFQSDCRRLSLPLPLGVSDFCIDDCLQSH